MGEADDRMDPLEALRIIRVHIEATGDIAEGTPVAKTYAEIRRALEMALGPAARRRKAGKPQA